MTNLLEVKTVVKTGNKKKMTGLLWGDWKGYHKRYSKFCPVTCTDTAYIPGLGVNILSVTHALTKVFNVISEKWILVLKKMQPSWNLNSTYTMGISMATYWLWLYTQALLTSKNTVGREEVGRENSHEVRNYGSDCRKHINQTRDDRQDKGRWKINSASQENWSCYRKTSSLCW